MPCSLNGASTASTTFVNVRVRVLDRREEPDIGMLCPQKRTLGTSCDTDGWIRGSMRLLDLSRHKQGFSGAERTQRQALTIGAISFLIECSRRVLRSQASHALLVCVSSSDETLAGRHTRLEQA